MTSTADLKELKYESNDGVNKYSLKMNFVMILSFTKT